jgi:predicted nuclease of predicted toxin-antitoxin system
MSELKFLADESCDFSIVRILRQNGFDVKSIAEEAPGLTDSDVIGIAKLENRILITEDKDFGELVYAHQRPHGGVIFIRYPSYAKKSIADAIDHLVKSKGETLIGCFVVVSPNKIRILKTDFP